MKILPDSHLLVWLVAVSYKLPPDARELLESLENTLFFSAASIWELTIKYASGRADFTFSPALLRQALIEAGFEELPITATHGLAVGNLPALHKDPFDRILIAQAICESMLLLTSDETIAQYNGPIRLVK